MITKELEDYVRGQRAMGKSDAEIRQMLSAGGGWSSADMDEVLREASNAQLSMSPKSPKGKFPFSAAIAIALLALVAVGGYFGRDAFFANRSPVSPTVKAVEQDPAVPMGYHCSLSSTRNGITIGIRSWIDESGKRARAEDTVTDSNTGEVKKIFDLLADGTFTTWTNDPTRGVYGLPLKSGVAFSDFIYSTGTPFITKANPLAVAGTCVDWPVNDSYFKAPEGVAVKDFRQQIRGTPYEAFF